MTTVYDHRQSPPTALYARGSCIDAPGYVSAPLANLPPGLYVDGGSDPVPAGMVAVSSTRIVRNGLSVSVPTCEPATVPDPDLADATSILSDPAALDAVRRVVARVSTIATLGVAIEDWTIQGVLDAAEASIASSDSERGALILRHGSCLHAEWLRVIYHCRGEITTADRLWPYLYDLAVDRT